MKGVDFSGFSKDEIKDLKKEALRLHKQDNPGDYTRLYGYCLISCLTMIGLAIYVNNVYELPDKIRFFAFVMSGGSGAVIGAVIGGKKIEDGAKTYLLELIANKKQKAIIGE